MIRKKAFLSAFLLILMAVVSCAKPSPQESPLSTPSYRTQQPSPSLQSFKSPVQTPTPRIGPHFELDRPLRANSTVVTGKGPAGVPIVIVDVTRMGRELGSGVIGPDGRFSIQVSPLPAGHRIGIMLGDVSGTDINPTDFITSEEYVDIPLVGILFDTAMVEK